MGTGKFRVMGIRGIELKGGKLGMGGITHTPAVGLGLRGGWGALGWHLANYAESLGGLAELRVLSSLVLVFW